MKTVAVVQARMTSTRLPGKILMEVLGKPLLRYELERLREVPSIDDIVVATTENHSDDPVAELCSKMGVNVFRGSEHDVLSRYYGAALFAGADAIARFTADCPLLDRHVSERVIRHFLDNHEECDYCAADVKDTPRPYPRGMDTEIFPMSILEEVYKEAILKPEREHVTLFIYSRPERYRIWRATAERDLSGYRLTVDTPEDFELIKAVIERLYPVNPNFGLLDVIGLLERNPELARINVSVKQKAAHGD
jgi:spore coat polysaccharide biosynthesis protein SpsF